MISNNNSFLKIFFVFSALILGMPSWGLGQIGPIIWEEQFNHIDNWNIAIGNGPYGWGNGELQYYSQNNISIAPIPGEEGNNALKITAKAETGTNIVDQWGNPLHFTSGRVNSRAKISIKYGVIETRVRVPNLQTGGWPAIWMLGTSNYSWPNKGEIDIMEMGHHQAFRDLHDDHNGGNGLNNSTVNQVVGANAIFYSEDAIVPDNPLGAASLAWDPDDDFCRPYYNHNFPLHDRFLVYRTYWDQDSIRFTVIDNGIEYDLYTEVFNIDEVSDEFQQPFYFVANLAIGGSFTDAYNLGDPTSGLPITLPLPAEMYIDYIKVMEWNGKGEVHFGPPNPQFGTFGVFTEETPVTNKLTIGENANIYAWEGTLSAGNISPFEGDNVISWQSNGLGWFGGGILSTQPINLFNFGEGNLSFRIKIPPYVSFKIGIIDAWGNQNYVEFPANQAAYGLERNGEWGQAKIPISELRGTLIDLRMMSYEFVILEENGLQVEFAIDDIYWEGGILTGLDEPTQPSPILSFGNSPNPFKNQTIISYQLREKLPVKLEVYNMEGKLIQVLINEIQDVGEYQIKWDTLGLSPGTYFCKITAGNHIKLSKCIIQI